MNRLLIIVWTTFSISAMAVPQALEGSVAIDMLGQLDLHYVDVQQVGTVEKSVSTGSVSALPGAALQIIAPMSPQQIDYVVVDGESVTQGQRIAMLSGSEVHHFRDNLKAKEALRTLAKARFDANKPLSESRAISQAAWFDIAQQFYDADLAWEHLNHFAEMFEPLKHDDKGYLLAAEAGVFRLPQATNTTESTLLGSILHTDSIRLTTHMSTAVAQQATTLATNKCEVSIDNVEQVSHRLLVRVWSSPLPETCGLQLGELAEVSVHLDLAALKISAESVFYINGQSAVFKLSGDTLDVVPVEIVGESEGGALLLQAHPLLVGRKVLSSSVSAVQGILLGLGGIE